MHSIARRTIKTMSGAVVAYQDKGENQVECGERTLGTDPIATTNGSTTVTITAENHNLVPGWQVNLSGATAVGGITLLGSYTIVSAPTADTFTITHGSAAMGTATGGGTAVALTLILGTNPFSGTGSTSVTVTHTAHGLAVGDRITFSGGTAVGGVSLNGTFNIITVPNANSYTITANSSVTGTGGGTPTWTREGEYATQNLTLDGGALVTVHGDIWTETFHGNVRSGTTRLFFDMAYQMSPDVPNDLRTKLRLGDVFTMTRTGITLSTGASLDGTKLRVIGLTHNMVEVQVLDFLHPVTTIAESQTTLTNPFTTTSLSAAVSVADTLHGLTAGMEVTFTGASAVGGITIDGRYLVSSVTNANTYVITHSAAASGSATGGGAVVRNRARTFFNLTNPFSTTIGSPVVTVTHTSHGMATGDAVYFAPGATAVGGLTISGRFTVTRINANSYSITFGSNAASTAGPGGGTVSTLLIRPCTITVNRRSWRYRNPDPFFYSYGRDRNGNAVTLTCTTGGTGVEGQGTKWDIGNNPPTDTISTHLEAGDLLFNVSKQLIGIVSSVIDTDTLVLTTGALRNVSTGQYYYAQERKTDFGYEIVAPTTGATADINTLRSFGHRVGPFRFDPTCFRDEDLWWIDEHIHEDGDPRSGIGTSIGNGEHYYLRLPHPVFSMRIFKVQVTFLTVPTVPTSPINSMRLRLIKSRAGTTTAIGSSDVYLNGNGKIAFTRTADQMIENQDVIGSNAGDIIDPTQDILYAQTLLVNNSGFPTGLPRLRVRVAMSPWTEE